MKKLSKPSQAQGDEDDRHSRLQFKKKKQLQKERNINYKNIRSLTDLDNYDE